MNFGKFLVYSATFFSLYVAFFYLVTILENRRALYLPKLKGKFPSVAFIVPCYNEEKSIAQTVESLLALDYPRDKFQILVIDDGSRDGTFKIAKQFEKQGPVKVYHQKNGGKHTALNYGLAQVHSEFVGTLDADSFVDPQALKKMLPYFADSNVQAVTSSLKVYQPKNFLQYLQNVEYALGIYLRKALTLIGSLQVTPGPLTIFRRAIFEEIGYYRRAHLTEDGEIALRLQSYNYQIENAVNAYVYTVSPDNFKSLYKQRVRWYQGTIRNAWDYRHLLGFHQGNFGLLVFPAILLSVFFLFSVSGYILGQTISQIGHSLLSWQAVGFAINQFNFHFDWFFISSHWLVFLGLFGLAFTALAIILGQKLSRDTLSWKLGKGLILTAFFYTPLYLIWWSGALAQVLLRRQSNWLKEKENE